MTPEQISVFETQKSESLQTLKEELENQIEADKLSERRIAELRVLARKSLDEHRDAGYFHDRIYKRDFINQPEVKNQVSSVLSAMVTQIEHENFAVSASIASK